MKSRFSKPSDVGDGLARDGRGAVVIPGDGDVRVPPPSRSTQLVSRVNNPDLSTKACEVPVGEQARRDAEEGFVNVVAPFPADA